MTCANAASIGVWLDVWRLRFTRNPPTMCFSQNPGVKRWSRRWASLIARVYTIGWNGSGLLLLGSLGRDKKRPFQWHSIMHNLNNNLNYNFSVFSRDNEAERKKWKLELNLSPSDRLLAKTICICIVFHTCLRPCRVWSLLVITSFFFVRFFKTPLSFFNILKRYLRNVIK